MSDLFSSPDDPTSKVDDREIQEFLMIEKQKAQFNSQIHEFNSVCWEKCIDKPTSKMESKTEMCLNNCVNRFIDVSLLITNRFAQMLTKSGDNY